MGFEMISKDLFHFCQIFRKQAQIFSLRQHNLIEKGRKRFMKAKYVCKKFKHVNVNWFDYNLLTCHLQPSSFYFQNNASATITTNTNLAAI